MKNILIISTYLEGGAGITANELNSILNENNYNSIHIVKRTELSIFPKKLIVLEKFYNYKKYSIKWMIKKIKKKIEDIFFDNKKIQTNFRYQYYFTKKRGLFSSKQILNVLPFKPDVIIVYWISDFISYKTLSRLQKKTNAMVLIRMADNSPITGGCHYPWECEGYTRLCENCPAIIEKRFKGYAKNNLLNKAKYITTQFELLSGSQSDYSRAIKSSVFKKNKIINIMSYVDENKFTYIDKRIAKEKLNIDENAKVLLFVVSNVESERKGTHILYEIVKQLNDFFIENKIILLVVGNKSSDLEKSYCINKGFLGEESLINCYQASDLFLSTSLEDSGPSTVRQALMCGTPVISFKIGVACDLITDDETGYLIELNDLEGFIISIMKLLQWNADKARQVSLNCREVALSCFSKKVFLNKISDVILDGSTK